MAEDKEPEQIDEDDKDRVKVPEGTDPKQFLRALLKVKPKKDAQ